MLSEREIEIRKNYAFFQDQLSDLMAEHAGEVALIRKCAIIGYYSNASEAVHEGASRYGALPFSVQHVIDRPIDLGFLSHAADHGFTA